MAGDLRSDAADYHASWQDYISGIINATKANQVTEGGPVIGELRILSGNLFPLIELRILAVQIGNNVMPTMKEVN